MAVLRAGGHRSPGWPEGSAPRQWSRRVLWPGQQGLGLAPDKPGGELRVRGAGQQPGRETPCHQDVPFSSCRAPPHPTGHAAGEMSVWWAGAWPPCIVQLGREEGQRGTGREWARLCSAPLGCPLWACTPQGVGHRACPRGWGQTGGQPRSIQQADRPAGLGLHLPPAHRGPCCSCSGWGWQQPAPCPSGHGLSSFQDQPWVASGSSLSTTPQRVTEQKRS